MLDFSSQLDELADHHLLRQRHIVEPSDGAHLLVNGQKMLAFCHNDYLGLQRHPALIKASQDTLERYGVGATASPLLGGYCLPHAELEAQLAEFSGLPRALYFHSGYAANVGAIPALVGREDAIFSDALNHACLIDGIRLSHAQAHIYPHLDLNALEDALRKSTARRKLIVTDAVFSMDGDIIPLPELLALSERYNAWLFIDDAHGFGVLGQNGRGTLEHFGLQPGSIPPQLIYMATLGKAAGVAGAFIAAGPSLIEWLLQRARTYMFATGVPPLLAAALSAALKVIAQEPARRSQLAQLRTQLQTALCTLPWRLLPSVTAIQPLIIGANTQALELMRTLWQQGIWAPAIRPPTVPAGTARLRFSLNALHTSHDIERLTQALKLAC